MRAADSFPLELFWVNGFAKLPGVFKPSEVAAWRRAVLATPERNRDLLSIPQLRGMLLHPSVVEFARRILGSPDVVYFGDSSINVGPLPAGFHKDNVDKDDANGPDWATRYPLIRFGLYMQDHTAHPDGVDLRQGSHEVCSYDVGKHVYGDTAIGDLMVWNLRTTHSGCGMMLKNGQAINPQSLLGKILRRGSLGLLRRSPVKRVATFWTFALEGPHLDRYILCHRAREYAYNIWLASPWDQEAREAARRAGVHLRDVRAEILEDPPEVLHKEHVRVPYERA